MTLWHKSMKTAFLFTRASHSAKSEDCRGETMLLDLRREYHRSAYNALCAVIACTQAEQKFYTGFLFTENKIKVSTFIVALSK